MPPTNNHTPTGAIIAISVIAAAAFAVYESPEVRQFAEDLRRRFAQSLHSMGDNVDPSERRRRQEQEQQGQPLFNRPEDAEGVLNGGGGVDADEASRRRQMEEFAYWNHLREQQQAEASQSVKTESESAEGKSKRTRSSSFGNFLQQDEGACQGTYILSSAVEPAQTENLVQRRVGRGIDRGAIFADPFGDEHGIELGERADAGWGGQSQQDKSRVLIAPGRDEVVSVASEMESEDLYGADDNRIRTAVGVAAAAGVGIAIVGITTDADVPVQVTEMLIDTSEPLEVATSAPEMQAFDQEEEAQYATPAQYPQSEANELDAYAAIHAWADNAHTEGFYSPLPTTPTVLSETSEGDFGSVSDAVVEGEGSGSEDGDGVATPRTVDSLSVVGGEAWESASESEDGSGRSTPGSWTEVGSVVSSEAERGV